MHLTPTELERLTIFTAAVGTCRQTDCIQFRVTVRTTFQSELFRRRQ